MGKDKQSEDSGKDYLLEELKQLNSKVIELKAEVHRLVVILKDNDLEDEIGVIVSVSPEMEVCIKGIDQILERVRSSCHDNNDIKDFDILHKNLRMIKGLEGAPKKKSKPVKIEDLLSIVKDGGNGGV